MTIFPLAVLILFSQGLAVQPSQTGSGVIEGVVVKTGTREAVSRVSVSLVSENSEMRLKFTTTTDGKFVFENLPAGSYLLSADLNGYVPTEFGRYGTNGHGTPIILKEGERMADLQLAMVPTGVVAGRVFDRNGEPLGRAEVQAWKFFYQDGARALTLIQEGWWAFGFGICELRPACRYVLASEIPAPAEELAAGRRSSS